MCCSMVFDPHNPKLLTMKDAARKVSTNGPYAIVKRIFGAKNYEDLAQILRREKTVLEADAVPSFLLWLPDIDYAALGKEMQNRGAFKELTFCATVSQRLGRDLDIQYPAELDMLARQYAGNPGALKDLVPHYVAEFKHFYEAHRHRHDDA